MSIRWIKTRFPGVRCRQHPTRKHGVQFDRYYVIYFQLNGKRKEEGVGWAGEGWTPSKVFALLNELKTNHRTGEGPQSLSEKRRLEDEKRQQKKEEQRHVEKSNITFSHFFEKTYLPIAKTSKKPVSYRKEEEHFKLWLNPVLKKMSLKKIYPLHLERVKKNMVDAGRSARSIQYVFATFRQIWNMAKRDNVVINDSPTKRVKIPKIDNKRLRFLSKKEADDLLEELETKSLQVHDIAKLSLHCGCRAGEIFKLKWKDVDIERGMLTLWDTKDKSRIAFMTEEVKELLSKKTRGAPADLLFPGPKGGTINQISNVFSKAVEKLELNKGIADNRERVVFHTMRHTFASWLAEDGTDLYTIQKLMGHSTIAMTERYSHLSPDYLQNAVRRFDRKIKESKKTASIIKINTA